jgi:DNA-binding MarR family transcriptional regulator
MDEAPLDEAILLRLRRMPGSSADVIAERLGLPRTNFGRRMKKRLTRPLQRLVAAGLIEENHRHYRLTQEGRKTLAER